MIIHICDSRPPGRELALFNEAGLDHGPQKWEKPLEDLYNQVCKYLPGMTVYTVVLRSRSGSLCRLAKAYIDYTVDDPAAMLARMARLLQKDPQAAAGYDIDYDPAEKLLHVGLWVLSGTARTELRKRLKLLREMGQ